MPELYGLIGKKLTHSFSKNYFNEKFKKEGLKDKTYKLFELEQIDEFPDIIKNNPDLKGLNVTIPYKEDVIPYLDKIDPSALKIGAVNVIKVDKGVLRGYNSDFYGFRESLAQWIDKPTDLKGLVLGTGGASKAVMAALDDLSIPYQLVSRNERPGQLTYGHLQLNPGIVAEHTLIINTTPLGMYPNIDSCPDIPYARITASHYLYDLVYNPERTKFLNLGKLQGASIKNGLEMLHLQAERSWELWQNDSLGSRQYPKI